MFSNDRKKLKLSCKDLNNYFKMTTFDVYLSYRLKPVFISAIINKGEMFYAIDNKQWSCGKVHCLLEHA